MTENKPLISVIIPIYNAENYLSDCLDSVCFQTYQRLEIIAIDDGSTDHSAEILLEYSLKDDRIKIITQRNQGLSSARNVGLECAGGEYILFLDSDDWIDEKTCNTAVKMITDTKSDVVLWSYTREYSTGSKPVYLFGTNSFIWDEKKIDSLYQQFIGLQGEQLRTPQNIDTIVTAWGKLYRTSVIGDIRFVDTKIIGTEDALFNIQVFSKVRKAAYIPNTLSHYRKTNLDSLTRSYKNTLVYQWEELYKRIEQHLKIENALPQYYQALNNRVSLGLIGLGLNLAEDDKMRFTEKKSELRKILKMSHYRNSIARLPFKYLPVHWKIFFLCAKEGWAWPLLLLLLIMNKIRSG